MSENKQILSYNIRSSMEISKNPYQGDYKKVLCVCSAGILRSATTAVVLSKEPYNFNTRNVGLESYALIPITEVLLEWADEIVCMTLVQKVRLQQLTKKPIKCLDIPDSFEYRNPELEKLIIKAYK